MSATTATTTTDDTRVVTLSGRTAAAFRVLGWLAMLAGLVMIVAGATVWGVVSSELAAEKIVVAEDATLLPGAEVTGPLTAYAEAEVINHHALEASDGQTYAQLDRDDPMRATVMNASFLRASLFTSVVSFGVAVLVIGMGLFVGLVGWALTRLSPRRAAAD
ncbi:MAG: hypothetical protein J0G30_08840 [Actinomycetales bacterium]|nr:hypothetical protein [Actinomycetales bacterium]